jgi:four helix bundle protein
VNNDRFRRGADIAARLLGLSMAVQELLRTTKLDDNMKHVASRLARSSTAAGASYEEARAAESRADFVHELGVALKEVRESVYWVRLIARVSNLDLARVVDEGEQLAAILGKSVRTASRRDQ